MELTISERLKHRLAGATILLSMIAIFIPAMIKQSTQRFDGKLLATIQVPPKPVSHTVIIPNEKAVFQKIKVSHIKLPEIPASTTPLKSELVQAQALHERHDVRVAQAPVIKEAITAPVKQHVLKPVTIATVVPSLKPVLKSKISVKDAYAVQLATFSEKTNALTLINRLKSKGYRASIVAVKTSKGLVYKVLVGQPLKRQQAEQLQRQLAVAMNLQGFIVPSKIT